MSVLTSIPTASIDALAVAQMLALEKLSSSGVLAKIDYDWLLSGLTANATHSDVDTAMLTSAVGQYDWRRIEIENGTLF